MSLYKSFFTELYEASSERVAREAPAALKAGEEAMDRLVFKNPNATKPYRNRGWKMAWAITGLEDKMKEPTPKLPEAVEKINALLERNIPTSPDKWAKAKAAARAKFKVYPSAYANLWAAKKYKSMGGGWKKGKK
jgi:hypothetical protein